MSRQTQQSCCCRCSQRTSHWPKLDQSCWSSRKTKGHTSTSQSRKNGKSLQLVAIKIAANTRTALLVCEGQRTASLLPSSSHSTRTNYTPQSILLGLSLIFRNSSCTGASVVENDSESTGFLSIIPSKNNTRNNSQAEAGNSRIRQILFSPTSACPWSSYAYPHRTLGLPVTGKPGMLQHTNV